MNMRLYKAFLCLCITTEFVCFSACVKRQPGMTDNMSVTTSSETISTTESKSGFIGSTASDVNKTAVQENFENGISEKNESTYTSTSAKASINNTELSVPQKLLFISDDKENICSSDTTTQVIAKVNAYINDGTLKAMKMAVSDDTICNIKSTQKCIEIVYETTQSLHTSAINGAATDYEFNKILLVLNGDYKGLLFFAQNGTYLPGPIKGSGENYINDILSVCS